jgi:hypothetical protein
MVKVTVPVGVPWYPDAATTAVKVTGWPGCEGFDVEVSVVVDGCKLGAFTV